MGGGRRKSAFFDADLLSTHSNWRKESKKKEEEREKTITTGAMSEWRSRKACQCVFLLQESDDSQGIGFLPRHSMQCHAWEKILDEVMIRANNMHL